MKEVQKVSNVQNFQNTLYINDNLFILNGLNSESVDLIYLDPPFNSKKTYSAPLGSKSAGASFKDMWTWGDVNEAYLDKLVEEYPSLVYFINSIERSHSKGMKAYVTYMTQRVIEMHRVLKKTGSLYLHCDPTASHYLKQMLDSIFGKDNFKREIIWALKTTSGFKSKVKGWVRGHDTILYYTKSNNFFFDKQYLPYNDKYIARFNKIDEEGRKYRDDRGNGRRQYLDEMQGIMLSDTWDDIMSFQQNSTSNEFVGYPTQKPLALLERIIKASSQKGNIVLDPFCGCATACIAAQRLERNWIGIDIENKALDILIDRLEKDGYLQDKLSFKSKGVDFICRKDIPKRTDILEIPIHDKSVKERLFKEQKGHCKACDIEMRIIDFEVDHIIPQSKGGGDYYENYQLLCSSCNRIKGNRPMEYLRAKIQTREKYIQKVQFGE